MTTSERGFFLGQLEATVSELQEVRKKLRSLSSELEALRKSESEKRKALLLEAADDLDGIIADWPNDACKHGADVIELLRSMANEGWGAGDGIKNLPSA